MAIYDIHEAEQQLARLVEDALRGDEVVISRSGRPVVKLVPVEEASPPRQLGTAAGRVRVAPDFDEPLPGFED